MVDDGPVVPVGASAIDVKWLLVVSCELFSKFERDYQGHRVIIDEDSGKPADVSEDVVEDLGNMFTQEALARKTVWHPSPSMNVPLFPQL